MAPRIGLPIGNLTSQIFANIYLHEFDHFIVHTVKPNRYLRYGDDFLLIAANKEELLRMRQRAIEFLCDKLGLAINPKNDIIVPVKQGLHFLGVELFPTGRRLKKRNWRRIKARLASHNIPSYHGLVEVHANHRQLKYLDWLIIEYYAQFF